MLRVLCMCVRECDTVCTCMSWDWVAGAGCVWCAGGGAIEMELSKYLRDHSRTIAGKEQLLIGCMAKALEVIPRQLCDNAGFDATNVLNKLRQKHAQGQLCISGSLLYSCTVKTVVPYSITSVDHRAVPVVCSQPTGNSHKPHKPGGRLLLLFTRPAVTLPPKEIHPACPVPNYAAWWHRCK